MVQAVGAARLMNTLVGTLPISSHSLDGDPVPILTSALLAGTVADLFQRRYLNRSA